MKEKKNKKRLFSKALFKQSCKANGMMWLIITFAVCFMLACVMLISGTSGIASVKEGIEDTIIKQTIEAEIQKTSIDLYNKTDDAEYTFDKAFAEKINELNSKDNYKTIRNIKNEAENKGTGLVTDIVTQMITNEVEGRITPLVENYVTKKITQDVTSMISNEISQRVQAEAGEIESEVRQAVTNDMSTSEAKSKISELVSKDSDINNLISTKAVEIIAASSGSKSQEEALLEAKQDPEVLQLIASKTDPVKGELTLQVIKEYTDKETELIKNQHINKAKNELSSAEHQKEVTAQVMAKNKQKYISEGTEIYKEQLVEEIKEEKLDDYTNTAKKELSYELKSLENKATDEITKIITDFYIKPAYEYAVDAVSNKYSETADESVYGAAMVTINPDNQADDKYVENNEEIPEEYINDFVDYIKDDILAWENGNAGNSLVEYIDSNERNNFRHDRAYNAVSFLSASEMTKKENKQDILDKLVEYNVNEEKYDSMGFDYSHIKLLSYEASEEYQKKLDYETKNISDTNAIKSIKEKLLEDVGGSLLDKLPDNVTDGIKELGTMDLYGLLVGSIFYKMAGLLLPIIYIIMVSNNLIASQVDTGSMAYILSTSTRRKEVTFTQALYLIGSTALMFVFTCLTSIVCFNIADVTTELSYEKLIYLNIGAFITMFAISGINFLASCYFDRSKRAMALGGGISMFFLVTIILGLFGSPVIPSVVRIESLNYFNYFSLISLFDVVSILDGGNTWMYKAFLLLIIGLICYLLGSLKFKKKDLPL